jgi:hypothetical protein
MKMMQVVVLGALAIAATGGAADAQYGGGGLVPPRWTYSGSAVCPENYDYYGGWCRPRMYQEYGGGYDRPYRQRRYYEGGSDTVPARWNRYGQAVCPNNFDYAAHIGRCVSRY